LLGYPDAALADMDRALKDAREIGQATTLMFVLCEGLYTAIFSGNHAAAKADADELVALADEKGALNWKAFGLMLQGLLVTLTGNASKVIQTITFGIAARRSTGPSNNFFPLFLMHLAKAHADLGQFDEARRCIGEAMTTAETTKETWSDAEIHRTAGEIALMSPQRDMAKAEACFDRALAIARAQQAKSWELRAATSMARLWRDQGKRQRAHDLLAPVYGWFTEGFDTLDLNQAKGLLEQLST
jgi:predicted ATPase